MKVLKQEETGLRKVRPGIKTVETGIRASTEAICAGADREEKEREGAREYLTPWERRAWDKLITSRNLDE